LPPPHSHTLSLIDTLTTLLALELEHKRVVPRPRTGATTGAARHSAHALAVACKGRQRFADPSVACMKQVQLSASIHTRVHCAQVQTASLRMRTYQTKSSLAPQKRLQAGSLLLTQQTKIPMRCSMGTVPLVCRGQKTVVLPQTTKVQSCKQQLLLYRLHPGSQKCVVVILRKYSTGEAARPAQWSSRAACSSSTQHASCVFSLWRTKHRKQCM
jgi:hypothetical protein